jgi:signal transduction histidine kinase/CheY-like chemotaxis protein
MACGASPSAELDATEVLVVDDEPMVRDFVARVLSRNGFACRTVSDAAEAVASATDRPPSMVVTDIRMPGRDGYWLLAELRKRWPEMPVIMLTAVSEAKDAVECLKAGAQDYLLKPIDIDELLKSVQLGAESVSRARAARNRRQAIQESVKSVTARLQGALQTIELAYEDTLNTLIDPDQAKNGKLEGIPRIELSRGLLRLTETTELRSLRIADQLIGEGRSHIDVATAIVHELVGEGKALYARLWARRGQEPCLSAILDVGESHQNAPSLPHQALSGLRTLWEERNGLTSVATPIVVAGLPEYALELGWRRRRDEGMGTLAERVSLILAASLARENDVRERMRAAEELDLFQKLASASRYSLDLQHVAGFLMKSLHRIVDYDVAALVLLEDPPSLTVQARCPMDDEFSQRVRSHIWNTLKLTCGVEEPADLELHFLEAGPGASDRKAPSKLRSFVNVPLSIGGSVVGLFHVSSGKDHAFRAEEVLCVHRAADFLAGSVLGVRQLLATVKGRVEQMVDHMTDGVLMLDARGNVVAMNGAARQLLGCGKDAEDLDAAALAKLLEWNPMEQLRDGRESSLRKLVCLRGVPYQTQLSPVVDERGELVGTVLAFRDFEEEKKAEEAKTELVNVVSHELRTPLTAIRNALFLLKGPRLGELSAEQNRFVELARRNVEQLIDIINDLLDLSKIEAGKMPLDLEPMSVADPIADVLAALEPQAEHKGLILSSSIAPDLPVVHGHAASVSRILVNLVGNAIKFTERGGRVSVSAVRSDGENVAGGAGRWLRITVSDSGVGIPPEQLESIFEKFAQVEAREQPAAFGTGLGLSICRELVKAHHGRIWAESEAGRGSKFIVMIPVLTQAEVLRLTLSSEMARARDSNGAMALVIARLEDVDSALSELGSADPSRVLDDLVAVTRTVIRRPSDRVLWQKDSAEIAVILPRTDREGGRAFASRLLEAFGKTELAAKVALKVTVVQYPDDGRSPEDLYRRATEEAGEIAAA